MKRLLAAVSLLSLIAATPEQALSGLEDNGYYIEPGASVSEDVVGDAVFDGRADGGRLYLVVLAEEPPSGAIPFSDSVLDLLGGDGYVVTVAPESVGWAGDGSHWSEEEMDSAVDASLDGDSDDEVVTQFIQALTGSPTVPGGGQGGGGGDTAGVPWGWILLLGGGGLVAWAIFSSRSRRGRMAGRLEEVKAVAKQKLAEVANDILEMEDEVGVSDNPEVKQHYQRASATYTQAIDDTEEATTVAEMIEVTNQLDMAIWELVSAEALLDGKPKPPKPEPAKVEPVVPPPAPGDGVPTPDRGRVPPPPGYDRRPQRQTTGSDDLLSMLMAMMMMGGMRGPGGFGGGGFGGFGGGGGRMGGGGGRFGGGGGRMRGGGRRR